MEAATAIVRHHHQHRNGRGYPAGLAGIDIPEGARIVAAADASETLASERPGTADRSPQAAYDTLLNLAGERLDPAAGRHFQRAWEARRIAGIYRQQA